MKISIKEFHRDTCTFINRNDLPEPGLYRVTYEDSEEVDLFAVIEKNGVKDWISLCDWGEISQLVEATPDDPVRNKFIADTIVAYTSSNESKLIGNMENWVENATTLYDKLKA